MTYLLTGFVENIFQGNHQVTLDNDHLLTKEAPLIKELLSYQDPIHCNELSVDVLNLFIDNKSLYALAIVDDLNQPVGLIDKASISEIFVKPYTRDLYNKQKITEIMNDKPIIVNAHTSIDDLARLIIDSGMQNMMYGFIIVQNNVYVGMATGHALLQEITERKQQDLYNLAHYDQLTGIPNRLLFKDRIAKACEIAGRNGKQIALVYIDLDRFKFYNDTMGHSFGDLLLINVAKRLNESIRKSDTVARLGGDEFVIILQNIIDKSDCIVVLEKILSSLQQPMVLYDKEINITASLGVALFPEHAKNSDQLISKADAAMYEVKEKSRNGYLIYSEEFDSNLIEKNQLEVLLKSAIANNELSLAYQPQVHLVHQNRIIGVEALLRWNNPELGFISPAKFIPIAEETHSIHEIGLWVLKEACLQHVRWIEQGLPKVRVAVNVSGHQLYKDDFIEEVRGVIIETGIEPGFLELELTESILVNEIENTLETLNALRDMGVQLAIDDFGTGYSSLSYLRRLPVNKIKIDRSFVANISNVPANEAIFKAVIALGSNLGLSVIAEGVENLEELACMKSHNCQEAQGFHFSKPISAAEFPAWLKDFQLG